MCYTLSEMRWGDFSLHTCPNNARIRRYLDENGTRRGAQKPNLVDTQLGCHLDAHGVL